MSTDEESGDDVCPVSAPPPAPADLLPDPEVIQAAIESLDEKPPPSRGRGRPPKPKPLLPDGAVPAPPRPRGRPPKTRDLNAPPPAKNPSGRKRGRPSKASRSRSPGRPPKPKTSTTVKLTLWPPRGRGRPRKSIDPNAPPSSAKPTAADGTPSKRKPGRPPKARRLPGRPPKPKASPPVETNPSSPRPVGRPPKPRDPKAPHPSVKVKPIAVNTGRKPGRPPKSAKGRGRPPKPRNLSPEPSELNKVSDVNSPTPTKKKPGRPPKLKTPLPNDGGVQTTPRPRGRPPKALDLNGPKIVSTSDEGILSGKKRGRPIKVQSSDSVEPSVAGPSRGRGRPRKVKPSAAAPAGD